VFDTFLSRLELNGTLRLETALRVGAGRALEPDEPDLPVVKDIAGRPYLPGSSFKGVLRSYAESLLRAAAPEPGRARRVACNPLSEANSGFCRCITPNEMRGYKDNRDGLDEKLLANTCLVCQTFGAQWLASPVQIRDLRLSDDFVRQQPLFRYERRNGVAIERDTETASNGKLYDFEVIPAGVTFEFRALVENAEPFQLGLFCMALRAFEQGRKSLGGAASRGLGGVRLMWTANYVDAAPLLQSVASPQEKVKLLFDQLEGTGGGQTVKPGDAQVAIWITALREEIVKVVSQNGSK
jgi:CRISPR-associated RAMP protein (TIGR02581 family)